MTTKYCLAVVDRLPGEANWSILFPGLPGVTFVSEKFGDGMRPAKNALASAVEDLEQDGQALPPSIEADIIPDYDWAVFHNPHTMLVPVEVSGRSLRVNISIDEGLLARVDDVSRRTGESQSSLPARAC